jgi:predicted esterase
MLVGFHGYGETADPMLEHLRAIAAGRNYCMVSVQALHPFYTRTQQVVANWMTSQDRESAIADNTAYVWSVVRKVERDYGAARPLVFVGFSQGVAMAYRAAAAAPCDAIIALAGDVPPDVAPRVAALPPILIGRGEADPWYTKEKAARDHELLTDAGARFEEFVFDDEHVWHHTFTARARDFLQACAPEPRS